MDVRLRMQITDDGGAEMSSLDALAAEEPDRFADYRNGYNNTHEALRFLRTAYLHLVCARLNGEQNDEFAAAHRALVRVGNLIEDVCEHDWNEIQMRDPEQMRRRFKRVVMIPHHGGSQKH